MIEQITKLLEESLVLQKQALDLLRTHSISPIVPSTIGATVVPTRPDYSSLPLAVATDLLVTNQERERIRGQQIAALTAHQLMPQLFIEQIPVAHSILDFGCGQGQVTAALKKYFQIVVGFDIELPVETGADFITDDRRLLEMQFDYIVVFDVIDHYRGDLDHLAGMLRQLLAPGGRLYLHCHPWTSIHGGHQYANKELNFSLLHLIASDEEYDSYKLPYSRRITRPLKTYESFVEKLGMKRLSRQIRHTPAQAFAACFDLYGEQICRHFPDTQIAEIKRIIGIEAVSYLMEKE